MLLGEALAWDAKAARPVPRFQWRCSRFRRFCDEPVNYGWGPAWAKCSSCPQTIELVVKRELDSRVVRVEALPTMNGLPARP
jgi:hypothetical protein